MSKVVKLNETPKEGFNVYLINIILSTLARQELPGKPAALQTFLQSLEDPELH